MPAPPGVPIVPFFHVAMFGQTAAGTAGSVTAPGDVVPWQQPRAFGGFRFGSPTGLVNITVAPPIVPWQQPRIFGGYTFGAPTGLTAPPLLPPDLLSALIGFLRTAPTITPLLTVGFGNGGFGLNGYGGGEVQVWDEEAPSYAYPPFVTAHGYTETLPGESLEDQPVQVSLMVVTNSLDQARTLGKVIKAALDSPSINDSSLERASFAFQGGTEYGVLRNDSKPVKAPGIGKGARFVYVEQIDYEFWVTPEQ